MCGIWFYAACWSGLPTIPTYIITASLAAPALLKLGVPLIVSHMFVFYYGIIADLTPPVALAALAAAPMAWMRGLYRHSPVVIERGEGSTFTDIDGNTYIDFNSCDLAMPAGYAPEPIVRATVQQAGRGRPEFAGLRDERRYHQRRHPEDDPDDRHAAARTKGATAGHDPILGGGGCTPASGSAGRQAMISAWPDPKPVPSRLLRMP